ncbi:MAG TPA: hypothetical protein VHB98_01080 [Chloroflexota bacterium]|jgi:hypothetical protein|nr:hypothetical protein [Chloroflexota bacterium]
MSMDRPPAGGRTALGVLVGAVLGAIVALVLRIAAAVARAAFGKPDRTVTDRRRTQSASLPPPPMADWSAPQPEYLIKPTYWPMVLALGIMFIFWGLTSSLVITGMGAILFILAIAYWIGELRHDP